MANSYGPYVLNRAVGKPIWAKARIRHRSLERAKAGETPKVWCVRRRPASTSSAVKVSCAFDIADIRANHPVTAIDNHKAVRPLMVSYP